MSLGGTSDNEDDRSRTDPDIVHWFEQDHSANRETEETRFAFSFLWLAFLHNHTEELDSDTGEHHIATKTSAPTFQQQHTGTDQGGLSSCD